MTNVPKAGGHSFQREIKYRLEYFFLCLILGILKLLPHRSALAFGKNAGRIIHRLLPSRAAIARKNLLDSFPGITEEKIQSIIRGCWENLGQGVAEFVKMPRFSDEEIKSLVETDGFEEVQKSYAAGKGVVFLTAHYGSWEWGPRLFLSKGMRMAVVARKVKNPYVNDMVTRIRSANGARVIFAREAVRGSIRWLKDGGLLAILIDHRITEGGMQVPFLGRAAHTTSLPAILALRYSMPVLPSHCWRDEGSGKIKFNFGAPMDFSDLGQSQEDIFEATLRMNCEVEKWVKERPEQWLWIHNRWKT